MRKVFVLFQVATLVVAGLTMSRPLLSAAVISVSLLVSAGVMFRTAIRSAGLARGAWALQGCAEALAAVLAIEITRHAAGPQLPVPTGSESWPVLVIWVAIGVCGVAAFACVAVGRRPRGAAADLFDLAIVVAGTTYAVRELVLANAATDVGGWRQAATIAPALMPLTCGLLAAWVLFMPGARPRALRLLLASAGTAMVPTLLTWAAPGTAATLSGLAAIAVMMLGGLAALDPSAPEVARRAEPVGTAKFGAARLTLFAVALLLTPITVAIQAARNDHVNVPAMLWTSVTLAVLVLFRVRSLFDAGARATQLAAAREVYLARLVENISDLIVVTTPTWEVVYASPSAAELLGSVDPETGLASLVAESSLAAAADIAAEAISRPGHTITGELDMNVAGHHRSFAVTVTNLTRVNEVNGIIWVLRDVTVRNAFEGELRRQALHDVLTGLPNRTLLADRLHAATSRTARDGTVVGVLFIDLDDFKKVNDVLGHRVGDELIVAVADRLAAAVRAEDTVARLGGDEFAVVVEERGVPGTAAGIAERIQATLRPAFALSVGPVTAAASIGVAVGSRTTPDELLRQADVAMYEAKAAGKNFIVAYHEGMDEGFDAPLSLEIELAEALCSKGAFEMHYQPDMSLRDKPQVLGSNQTAHPEPGMPPAPIGHV